MIIDKTILSEKNYTGTRKILINDEKVRTLKGELKKLQKEINPILDGLAETFSKFDATNKLINEHQEEIKRLNVELQPDKDFYDEEMKKIEPVEKKAKLIKDKLEPLVIKLVEDQLGEFEKALHVIEDDKNGDIYVEVEDQIEKTVLRIREENAKKK